MARIVSLQVHLADEAPVVTASVVPPAPATTEVVTTDKKEVPQRPAAAAIYEYKVDLMRLWVERYKALGRVIEDAVMR